MCILKKVFFSGEICRPGFSPQIPEIPDIQPKKSPKKTGRPKKTFDEKLKSAKNKEASQLAKKSSLRLLARAAAIKSGQEGMKNAKHVFKKLEKDPEMKAYHYRQEEKAAKRKCKWQESLFIQQFRVLESRCLRVSVSLCLRVSMS